MVREIEISKLNAASYNPRIDLKPGMPEFEKLRNSMRKFGNVEPIVWNERTGNVVGGHQRLAVLIDEGATMAPCSVVDMSEEEEKVLNVALNKIKGEWDYDKLEEILSGFDAEVAEASGFAAQEIAALLQNSNMLDTDDFGDWDEDQEETDPIVGGSYVLTLVFANADLAIQWAENEGFEGQIKEGSNTTVIRIEE